MGLRYAGTKYLYFLKTNGTRTQASHEEGY